MIPGASNPHQQPILPAETTLPAQAALAASAVQAIPIPRPEPQVTAPSGLKKGAGSSDASLSPRYVALTGNPNCGKTTLFNALTGLRAKVANYAGVTVERKEGRLLGAPGDLNARVLDLPGTYSLSPQSLDEQISRDVLLNRLPELPAPALIVVVIDASD